jgi:rhodanese-related sulfurtransferase
MSNQFPSISSITAIELKRRLDLGEPLVLLDVREEDERALCAIPAPSTTADLHVPMGQIQARYEEIAAAAGKRPVVVYCHLGERSMVVGRWLATRGLFNVLNLSRGIDAWATDVDATCVRY